MKVEIFTHKNCTECNLLLEYLDQKGLLGRVQIIDTELYPFLALERGVISTPSVFIDGKLVYAGTVDFQEFEKLLQGEKVIKKI
ncbi:MAG: thioredoxin family protein, partial [Acidianus infernus]|nr:thioredoxin family protein [Acidianus infernus]